MRGFSPTLRYRIIAYGDELKCRLSKDSSSIVVNWPACNPSFQGVISDIKVVLSGLLPNAHVENAHL